MGRAHSSWRSRGRVHGLACSASRGAGLSLACGLCAVPTVTPALPPVHPLGLASSPLTRLPPSSTSEGPPDGTGPTAVTGLSLIPGPVSVTTQRPVCRTGDAHRHPQGLPQACVSVPEALGSVHLSVSFIPFLGVHSSSRGHRLPCGGNGVPEQLGKPGCIRTCQCSGAPCRSSSPASFLGLPPPSPSCPVSLVLLGAAQGAGCGAHSSSQLRKAPCLASLFSCRPRAGI